MGDGNGRLFPDAIPRTLERVIRRIRPRLRRHVKPIVAVLTDRLWFPDPRLADPDGLVAIGGDLSVPRLLLAYRLGIFPWTVNPVTWWSPDPRGIFELERFHVSRSLARVLRRATFEVRIDHAFRQVIERCAAPAPGRRTTWIAPEFIEAYTRLHQQGHAHCVECWQNGRLVGGIYGVALGALFAGESMFHCVSDASKVALFHLVELLKARRFQLFDIQMVTPITAQLGATNLPRDDYLSRLSSAVDQTCAF
jgi:leucyl/phenylalanyl-tRNA---protein transferase